MTADQRIRPAYPFATSLLAMCALAGCVATPMPVLTDFSEIKAEVRVPYDSWVGPSLEASRPAADPIGAEHCGSLGKTAVFVSARSEVTSYATASSGIRYEVAGVHIFLYRCEEEGGLGESPPLSARSIGTESWKRLG